MGSSNQEAPYGSALSRRHEEMDDSSMSEESSMNVGTITVQWFPQLYWIFVGSVIAAFTVGHAINVLLYHQRYALTVVQEVCYMGSNSFTGCEQRDGLQEHLPDPLACSRGGWKPLSPSIAKSQMRPYLAGLEVDHSCPLLALAHSH